MALKHTALATTLLATLGTTALIPRQDSRTITVDLSTNRGTPNHYGSGVLLGIPDATWPGQNADQIPDSFYERIAFRYNRGGGSQLPAGAWATGLDGYYARMNSTKSDYDKTRSFGAPYILLPHDIYGTDQIGQDDVWPGDDGDWSDYYAFLDQLTGDLVRLGMVEEMKYDVWNEPDVDIFWKRSIEQWVSSYLSFLSFLGGTFEVMG